MMRAIVILLLLISSPAWADVCGTLSKAGAQALRDGKSGGGVAITPQGAFPADVKPFVIKADPDFADQAIELYTLGKSGAGTNGAGLALHYEGTLATPYLLAFDRVGGKLKAVAMPELNPAHDDYWEAHAATVAGQPVVFNASGDDIVIAPWTGHGFGPVCRVK